MDLAKSAMLVSVTIINGGLLGERRDKTATGYVERKFNLHDRRAKASKFLIDRKKPQVKAVVAASQRVREVLYKYTMPWGDDKSRLLPVGVHEIFQQKIRDAEHELREAWKNYLHVYPALIADSERELGDLFDRSEYPSPERAADLFKFKLTYWPMPSSGHFVAEIADDAAKQATAVMALEIETRLKEAAETLVARAKNTVQIFVDRLSSFKSKADGKLIRDSLVNNCAEIGELIHDMNITNNPDIRDLGWDIQRLGRLTADTLRDDASLRQNAIKMGTAILQQAIKLQTLDHEVADMVAEAAEYDL
ncbi:MAG TPA: hypothetical protein VHK86_05700 [Nitrososphaera sp.]|nr:hypothetical protein [Nitrososphaera sp.]